MSGINALIDNEVKNNDVVLFMKGTPDFPQCGFSGQVVQVLDYVGVDYKGINVLADDQIRQGIKEYSNWPTIPQLYVKGELAQAVAEMAIKGKIGATINQPEGHNPVLTFYGEDQGRYVLSVREDKLAEVQTRAQQAKVAAPLIGRTGGETVILGSAKALPIEQLHNAYESWFPDYMNGEI